MAFKKYNSANNAFAQLNLPLADTDLTCVLKGKYGRFPTSNFIIKITKTSGGVVTARENIYVATRSGATCTGLVRAYEAVPIDDAATTNIQQALNFSADDVVEVVPSTEFFKDMQDEIDAKLAKVGGLGTGYGVNKTKYIDPTTGDEVLKDSSVGSSIGSTEIIISRDPVTGNEKRTPYSALQADMAGYGGGSDIITPYESNIAIGDPVAMTPDGLIECTTELKTSANVTASSITKILCQVPLDATRTFFVYSVSTTVFARIGTRSTTDVITYGTEVTVATGGTAGYSAGACLLSTDKIALAYQDGNLTPTAFHRIATIVGNAITLQTAVSQGLPNFCTPIMGVCKIRDTAYMTMYNMSSSVTNIYFHTVSDNTITPGVRNESPTGVLSPAVYLQDNRIGFALFNGGTTTTSWFIYEINPASTVVTTTYTLSTNIGDVVQINYVARVSDSAFVCTYQGVNTNAEIIKLPPSGTTLLRSTLVANGVVNYPVVTLGGGYFAVIANTDIRVYEGSVLKWTIPGFSAPTVGDLYQYMSMVGGRWTYLNGTNGTSQIVNFAQALYKGIANSTSGGITFLGNIGITGIKKGVTYYLQSDGTLSYNPTNKLIGIGSNTDKLYI